MKIEQHRTNVAPFMAQIAAGFALAAFFVPLPAAAEELGIQSVNRAGFAQPVGRSDERSAVMLKAQILLDRTRFSPGVVDGYFGANVSQAIEAYEKHHGLAADGRLDEAVWESLTRNDGAPVLTRYTISEDDVNGPFLEVIPDSFVEMAKLDRLSYTGPAELLAEKFHMDQELLKALNPDADFGEAGTRIVVADPGENRDERIVVRIEVDKGEEAVRAYDERGELVSFYPATIGSEENPAPSGNVEVRVVAPEPAYYYNPDDLSFQGVDVEGQVKIAPGPNNPVGTTWIDLTKEGYGIHGTPEPARIGKTASHGCVRLTNWDAAALARMVEQGTRVAFL